MRSDIYMVLSLAMSLASFGLISKWYVMPQLNVVSRAPMRTPLLLPHTFRHIGLSFLVPGVVSPSLASRTLADTTAYGDITAAAHEEDGAPKADLACRCIRTARARHVGSLVKR